MLSDVAKDKSNNTARNVIESSGPDTKDALKPMTRARSIAARRLRWDELFEVETPEKWTCSEENGVVSFFDPQSGVGALQVSFARRPETTVPDERHTSALAQQFALDRGWNVKDSEILRYEIAGAPVSEFSFIEAQKSRKYWCVWHVASHERIAFITYTCAAEDAEVEKEERTGIVQSFRWLSGDNPRQTTN